MKDKLIKLADNVTCIIGSWPFVIIQSGFLFFWIVANVVMYIHHWDPYPFILLNLVLSFQAAYTAPIIMISQNRQAERDRRNARLDLVISQKVEKEISRVISKLDNHEELIQILRTEVREIIKAALEQDNK